MVYAWTLAANALPEFRYGTVCLTKEPNWLACVRWFIERVLSLPCSIRIPFPDWSPRQRDETDPTLFTLSEWYGTAGDWWHAHVCGPALDWCWSHPKRIEISVDVGYDQLKELFGQTDAEFFVEMER